MYVQGGPTNNCFVPARYFGQQHMARVRPDLEPPSEPSSESLPSAGAIARIKGAEYGRYQRTCQQGYMRSRCFCGAGSVPLQSSRRFGNARSRRMGQASGETGFVAML